MAKSTQGRRPILGESNEYRVLRVVRDYSTISRVEIAQILGLSKATVTWIVGRFLKKGYLDYGGSGNSSVKGGRKRQLLRFNPRARYVIGVDIKLRSTQIAITDLNAEIVERTAIEYQAGSVPDDVLGGVTSALRRWGRSNPEYFAKAIGIGVGMPGVIDEEKGVVRIADALKSWREVNLKRYFEDEFDLATFVENDVKTMTVGEYLFGASRYVRDQVLLFIGDGIGAGIIVDGRLHRGVTSSAGEIGFNEIGIAVADSARFPLLVSNQRDFGDTLSDARFVEAYRRHGGAAAINDPAHLVRAAVAGDELAGKIIREAAYLVSIICIDLINTLNPETIVLGGKIVDPSLFIPLVQERVRDDILAVPAEAVQIVAAKLGADAVLRGAAGLVLYDLFKPVRTPRLRQDKVHAALLFDDEG